MHFPTHANEGIVMGLQPGVWRTWRTGVMRQSSPSTTPEEESRRTRLTARRDVKITPPTMSQLPMWIRIPQVSKEPIFSQCQPLLSRTPISVTHPQLEANAFLLFSPQEDQEQGQKWAQKVSIPTISKKYAVFM